MVRKVYGATTPAIPMSTIPLQLKQLLTIKKPLRVLRPTFM